MLSLVRICRFSIDKFPGISQRVCLKFSEFQNDFLKDRKKIEKRVEVAKNPF